MPKNTAVRRAVSTAPLVDGPSFKPVRAQRAFEVICEQIRDRISRGELRPGDRLPGEKELAEQFNISRTTVHEAMRSLEVIGLVEVRTGINGGAFIHSGNASGIRQVVQDMVALGQVSIANVTEARVELMATAIRLACERATQEDLEAIEADIVYHTELFENGGGSRNSKSVIRFYELIARATHNSIIVMMVEALSEVIRGLLAQVGPNPRKDIMSVRRNVLLLMRKRNAQAAAEAMTKHLLLVNDYLESESQRSTRKRAPTR
ncbi:MAG: FadR family transcriptional regulator [Proteobacteria bacterium]|nr:FadR family transcriptional regulator [Pseudomonadota bacterium]